MRKTMMVWSASAAALLPALAAGTASADGLPVQDIGQAAASEQAASSTATSTQTNPTNQAIHVAILSPGAYSGAVTQANDSAATSAAGNSNETTQNASQAGGGGGVQGVGQAAGNDQGAASKATSTQSTPTNQAIHVAILSPGAGAGAVRQSNDSGATSTAANQNETEQSAAQAGGGGGGVQGAGQLAENAQKAKSDASSTQSGASNQAIDVAILSPGAKGGAVSQSNSSAASSAAGNTNETTQSATQADHGKAKPAKDEPRCETCEIREPCAWCHPSYPTVQGIGQKAANDQQASSTATSRQDNPSNTAISLAILSPGAKSGAVSQSNDSAARSTAANSNETTQNASQSGSPWGGGVQAIGQLATNAQKAWSKADSTQWCPANLAVGTGGVRQSNASGASSAAGSRNSTRQDGRQALAGFLWEPVVV
jgi:hypothetical protein